MISEISPFKDFVCIKVCHNRRVRCFGIVLVCPCLYTNRTSKKLQTLLSLFFFSKFELPNRGCGLSTGAAYTRNFTVLITFVFPQFTSFHSVFHSFHGLMNSINWPASGVWVFIAQAGRALQR